MRPGSGPGASACAGEAEAVPLAAPKPWQEGVKMRTKLSILATIVAVGALGAGIAQAASGGTGHTVKPAVSAVPPGRRLPAALSRQRPGGSSGLSRAPPGAPVESVG